MAEPLIPNIVEWTVVPQKGTTTFYDDMNVWLSETNTVVNSWNTTLNSTNAVYQDINSIYNQIQNADPTSGYSQAYTNRALIAGYSEYKAVGGETSVLTADNTNLQLYKNDVLLILTTDYTLNVDGVTVDLVASLNLNDLVQWYDLNKLKNSFYTKDEVYTKTEIDNNTVKLTGNQTIAGIKNFNESPTVPIPTANNQSANKEYVDNEKRQVASVAEIIAGTDNAKVVTSLGINQTILAMGQTITDVSAGRAKGITYTNTTNKPVVAYVVVQNNINFVDIQGYIDGLLVQSGRVTEIAASVPEIGITLVIPHNSTYKVDTGGTISTWKELT